MKVTGSLQIRKGTYYMMVRVPDQNGKQKQKLKTTSIKVVGKNQRETRQNKLQADKMLSSWIEELSVEKDHISDKQFIFCIEDWLERKKRRVRLDTYEAYQCYYDNHLKPFFEPRNLKIDEVTPRLIQKYVDQKEKEGQSPNSINKHLVVLNGVFKEAAALQEVSFNPCANITISRIEEEFHGTAYEPADAKRLLAAIEGDAIEPAVYLGLYLGLRRSEVVGLRWGDIDFEHNVVHIRNTVVRFKTISEMEKTKSRASKRDLYLPKGLKQYLLSLRIRTETHRQLFGKAYHGGEHICQWPDGRTYTPDYVSRRFKRILELNNLPQIRFHDLRHTAGSLLINQGQSVKQVQEFLGHEKASTTLDIYTHLSFEGKKDTGEKLDELLSGAK
jgi:integrase